MFRIRDEIERLRRFCRSPLGVKLFRYVMGSVITTAVSFGVLTLAYGVVGWSAVPSTVLANVVATIPGYWLNRTWTWGKAGRSDPWREVIPFWVLSLLGIAISMGTAAEAEQLARAHHLGHLVAIVAVDGANLAAWSIIFVGKYLIFERLFQAAGAAVSARRAAAVGDRHPVLAGRPAPAPAPARYGAPARGPLAGLLPTSEGAGVLALPGEVDDEEPWVLAASGGGA